MIETLREERIVRETGYMSPRRAKKPWEARERVGEELLSRHLNCQHDDCDWVSDSDEPLDTHPFPIEKTSGGIWDKQTCTPQAAAFGEQHRIESFIEAAKTAVEECFPSRKALRIFLDEDPEEESQWIAIEVTIEPDAGDFLEAYNRCISLWVKRIPTEALTIIRLSYNLA
jgi:hypothetical protein